ncbi:intracellular chloride channel [Aureococcus anophagefferens]|nr:intracellular chloride channel [Aureococcus anophagefferens]
MARIQMKPRQKYVKPDPLFKSYGAAELELGLGVVFRVYGPDSYVSDYQRHYSLRLIVERLEMGGLQTKLYKSYHYDKIFCKIRCTSDRLKDQAAAVDYPLLMDETEVKMRIERGYRDEFGKYKWYQARGWKLRGEATRRAREAFNNAIVDTEGQSGYAFNEHIYGKYDKRGDLQSPSVYVTYPASNSIFRSVDRLKLMMGIMEGDIKQEGCSLILKELITRGACLAIYPLHDDDALQTIQDRWLTTWLFYAGALGIVTYALEIVPSPFAVWSTTFCGIFMSMWSTVFLEHWKSTQARAKMTWGMTGFEDTEQDRTEFEGREIHSPVTGMPEAYFPDSEKARRIACSYLQVILCMVYVSAVNAGVFYTYAYVSRWPVQGLLDFNAFFSGGFALAKIITNLLLALIIQFTNGFFMPFATRMNFIENHRTETAFEDNLIAKVFVFQFVNSYALFYVAMAQGPLSFTIGQSQPWKTQRFQCAPHCLNVVALLGTIFIIRVVMGNWDEVIKPYLARLEKEYKIRKESENDDAEYENPSQPELMRKRQISPAEEQYEKHEYDS